MNRPIHPLSFLFLLAACSSAPPATAPPAASIAASPETATPEAVESDVIVDGPLLTPMPTAVTSFGAALTGNALYVVGGYHGEPHNYSRDGQSNEVWRVELSPGATWERVTTFEGGGLQGLDAVAHDGEVCRFGGNRALNAEGEETRMESVAEAACLRRDGTWRALPDLPSARSSFGAALVGTTVYVVGGWRLEPEGGPAAATWMTEMHALDLADETARWETIPVPFERRAVGVASAGDKLVVLGGMQSNREVSRRVDVFDPTTQIWSTGPELPDDAFGAAAVGARGAVYASARSGVVHRWEIDGEAWTRHTTLSFPRFFHELVAVEEGDRTELVAVGGISGMHAFGRTRHVERVALDGAGPAIATMTLAYPGEAKNRQGLFLRGDHLFLFGGNNSLGQHDFAPSNFVADGWKLHLPSLEWERTAPYPHARQTMQTTVVGERGISVGGFGHDGEAAVSQAEAHAFDFERERWSPLAPLPRSRTQFGLTVADDRLWLFGGLHYDPSQKNAFDHVTETLVMPLDGAASAAGAPLPGPRRAFAGALHEGKYYIVGGMREGFALVDDCLVFDVSAKTYEPLPCPSHTRLSGHLVPLDGKLYLVGGSFRPAKKMESDRSVEVFDPQTQTWSRLLELPHDTRHMRAMAYRHRLLLFSTHHETPIARITLIDPGPRGVDVGRRSARVDRAEPSRRR